jgi:N-acetylneuraminic acid mutarotase
MSRRSAFRPRGRVSNALLFVVFAALVLPASQNIALTGRVGDAEPGAPRARRLTFANRVAAQRAIERVYHAGRIGSTRPFEEAVPAPRIERKVRAYLAQSAALEAQGTPLTAAALRRELERIAADTRFPERLQAIYAALNNDSSLIQETFVRAELAGRLAPAHLQDAFADIDRFDPARVRDVAETLEKLPEPPVAEADPACGFQDLWDSGATEAPSTSPPKPTAVWTGAEMLVWGGDNRNTGGRYDPLTDSWRPITTAGAPSGRSGHAAVWTGDRMIVWGGNGLVTGGRYDPAADAWTPTSTLGAPAGRFDFRAVWTGSVMIVWGGYFGGGTLLNTGARYNPSTDTWSPTSTAGAPLPGYRHVAVWSGTEMIVWGGVGTSAGGLYNPATDSWRPTSLLNAPGPRDLGVAVWTGTEMVVWGGFDGGFAPGGGRFDPATNTWRPTSSSGAPLNRTSHTMVWTGSRVVLWGGSDYSSNATRGALVNTGALYDPVADVWSPTTLTGAPFPRTGHAAVWSGNRMIVWGGGETAAARYDPEANAWLASSSSSSAPSPRLGHTAVWTGSEMIVWGGTNDGTGSRYDPLLDAWTLMSLTGAPTPRHDHTAVWTGSAMIVWGGRDSQERSLATGARYDPVGDTWAPTASVGAPSARAYHTAVWTGGVMVVWGGLVGNSNVMNSGGRYDPGADTWSATSLVGAPSARAFHTAVWTGSEMIVWGGAPATNTGGRYDPLLGTWTATSLVNAPPAVAGHTTVWTGQRMIVWGGWTGARTSGGGLYDPLLDAWTPTPTSGAPSARDSHTAVWTGHEMIVWGGTGDVGPYVQSLDTGGRFDPVSGTWAPTTTVNAPAHRYGHTAVWAGHAMIVRGGEQYIGDVVLLVMDDRVAWYGSVAALPPDADGDGTSVCEDCDDANAGVQTTPAEVGGLDLTGADLALLDWSFAGGGVRYDVLRSADAADFVSGAVCLESDDASDTTAMDAAVPPPGGVFYYLVRGENACPDALGEGPLGVRSDGQPIQGRACP